jgi:NADH-quinone oxidoreductase subunit J
MDGLFYLFSLVLIGSCAFVISVRNQVYSVLFLILAFFNAAALLILIGAEFMAMMFVIVYVGAVAVLFLFVIMMLETGYEPFKKTLLKYYMPALFVFVILVVEGGLYLRALIDGAYSNNLLSSQVIYSITNTEAIGMVLYTDYFIIFQIVGLILLAAMIAAIVLTLHHHKETKRQNINEQLSRDPKTSVVMVNVDLKRDGEHL